VATNGGNGNGGYRSSEKETEEFTSVTWGGEQK
jgi:hypothetical protein